VGLRLPWELPDGKVLTFTNITAFSCIRLRRTALPGTGLPLWRSGDTWVSEQQDETATELLQGPISALSLKTRTILNRARRDFISGLESLINGNKEVAADFFRTAAARDDSLADAYYLLAICTDNPDEQLTAADRALIQRKNFNRILRELGFLVSASIPACDGKNVRLMNDEPGLEMLASEVYQSHNKPENALKLLENSQHAELDIFRFSCGQLQYTLQQYEKCIDRLKNVRKNRLLAGPASYYLGLSLEKLGYNSTAIQVYRDCLETEQISKKLETAIRLQHYQLLRREGREYRAERELARLLALAPEYKNKII